eukprot:c4725_g1_i1.p1 GENE.c4725_g1_i1~~c4725_g1_i1.p1  ORF type:complete len:191 (+),score=24.22 c4725_g1_i1:92-664(+)
MRASAHLRSAAAVLLAAACLLLSSVAAQQPSPPAPAPQKCIGASSCSSCVKLSGCGWCTTPTYRQAPGPNGTTVLVSQSIGCVPGSFLKSGRCGGSKDWSASQCVISTLNLMLIVAGVVFLVVCLFCGWLYWCCHKRTQHKTKRLLDDHDSWVAGLHADSAAVGTPKTDAKRAEMRAKYGVKDLQGVPLL